MIRSRISTAAQKAGRDPASVTIVAVTKTVDAERVQEALSSGIRFLGENRVQEAREKIGKIGRGVQWHLIGHLQSNKARQAVTLFDMVHSLDTLRLAEALDREAGKLGKTVPVLVQVNLSGEESKFGLPSRNAIDLIRSVSKMKHLLVEGLMTIPPYDEDVETARPIYSRLRELAGDIERCHLPHVRMAHLSMGMSHDFETAVEEGATLVRIGTAIFGERKK